MATAPTPIRVSYNPVGELAALASRTGSAIADHEQRQADRGFLSQALDRQQQARIAGQALQLEQLKLQQAERLATQRMAGTPSVRGGFATAQRPDAVLRDQILRGRPQQPAPTSGATGFQLPAAPGTGSVSVNGTTTTAADLPNVRTGFVGGFQPPSSAAANPMAGRIAALMQDPRVSNNPALIAELRSIGQTSSISPTAQNAALQNALWRHGVRPQSGGGATGAGTSGGTVSQRLSIASDEIRAARVEASRAAKNYDAATLALSPEAYAEELTAAAAQKVDASYLPFYGGSAEARRAAIPPDVQQGIQRELDNFRVAKAAQERVRELEAERKAILNGNPNPRPAPATNRPTTPANADLNVRDASNEDLMRLLLQG